MLLAALAALGNMARGNATIPHWAWLVYCAWLAVCFAPDLYHAAAWFYIVVICTIRATRPLLDGINGDKAAIMNGVWRNLPILPAMVLYPWAGVMLMQGLLYFMVGKWDDNRATRVSEGITGLILGGVLWCGTIG